MIPSLEYIQECLTSRDAAREEELFSQARELTAKYFGNRITLFAPLYVSNFCVNSCLYCGFRLQNSGLKRRSLDVAEIRAEAEAISAMGHQTILIVAGEHEKNAGPSAIAESIRSVREVPGIRDVKVEVMPMGPNGYGQLYEAGARAVVLYQETYDRATYDRAHPAGPKSDYERRLMTLNHALSAGFNRIGLGILLGLGNPAFDARMMIAHAHSLHARWGVWPATISLPRMQPASEAPWSVGPPNPVDDTAFLRLIALIRTALPHVGIVLSTRETPEIRDRILRLRLGVTQLSAGSRTGVGGYAEKESVGQFSIGDERSPSEVADQLKQLGYAPMWADRAAVLNARSESCAQALRVE